MNKLLLLTITLLITIHLQAQVGLQITSICESDSLCLPTNECVAINQSFSISATTDCSTSNIIEYNFSIDLENDGVIDSLGSAASFTADFPIGVHRIKFTAFDFCGNEENCEFLFEVKDCVDPFIETNYVLDTFIMLSSGQIEFFPEQFIAPTTYDNCSSYENLSFSISNSFNNIDTSLFISCADLPCDGKIPLIIWAEDESGNLDSINIEVIVLDPNAGCPGFPYYSYVNSHFWSGEPMENSFFKLNNQYFYNYFHNPPPCNGVYLFEGDTMFIEHMGNDDPLNGVTTFDLVLIAKHILGTELFYSPYQSIAADVNSSGTITALDIVIIRSLILHIADEFPGGKSWVYDPPFIDMEHQNNYEFIGVKLGDVNGSADPNSLQNNEIESRTFDGSLNVLAENKIFKVGETITLSTFSDNFKNIAGGQFTIEFDPTALEFQKIEGNHSIQLEENNFGKNQVENGFILCSWNTSASHSLKSKEEFLKITLIAKKDGRLSDFLSITSKKLANEIYVENGSGFKFWNAVLDFENEESENSFSLAPNPFSEKTTFSFSLENDGMVELEIFDTNGRLVFSQTKNMTAGENQLEIQKSNLPANGIYFYKIKIDFQVNSGKLILF